MVQEAADAQTYVSAHLYTAEAIKRAVRCGVHSLEHCNIIDAEAARLAAAANAVAVPTLVIFEALAEDGPRYGLPPESIAKIGDVRNSGLASLEIMQAAGVTMAYGTDLLGETHCTAMRGIRHPRARSPLPGDLCRCHDRGGKADPDGRPAWRGSPGGARGLAGRER